MPYRLMLESNDRKTIYIETMNAWLLLLLLLLAVVVRWTLWRTFWHTPYYSVIPIGLFSRLPQVYRQIVTRPIRPCGDADRSGAKVVTHGAPLPDPRTVADVARKPSVTHTHTQPLSRHGPKSRPHFFWRCCGRRSLYQLSIRGWVLRSIDCGHDMLGHQKYECKERRRSVHDLLAIIILLQR